MDTLVKKQLVAEALNSESAHEKYTRKVEEAIKAGFTTEQIIAALDQEIERIKNDHRPGDPLFLHGIHNSKVACISSISATIMELKGQTTDGQSTDSQTTDGQSTKGEQE